MQSFEQTCVYFDTQTWDWVADYWDRDNLVRHLSRNRRYRPVSSVVNFYEILRIGNHERRAQICQTVELCCDRSLAAHPMVLLELAAKAFRQGDAEFTVENDEESGILLGLAAHPERLTPEDRLDISAWVQAQDRQRVELWKEIETADWRSPGLVLNDAFLRAPKLHEVLADYPSIRHLSLTPQEVNKLIRKCEPWRAFAAVHGVMLEIFNQKNASKSQIDKQPNVLDLLQLNYLGVFPVFLTRDKALREAARKVAQLFTRRREVYSPDAFFPRQGFC